MESDMCNRGKVLALIIITAGVVAPVCIGQTDKVTGKLCAGGEMFTRRVGGRKSNFVRD